MDYTLITDAVDWAQVLIGIGVIAAAIAGLEVAIRGARVAIGFIRGR